MYPPLKTIYILNLTAYLLLVIADMLKVQIVAFYVIVNEDYHAESVFNPSFSVFLMPSLKRVIENVRNAKP